MKLFRVLLLLLAGIQLFSCNSKNAIDVPDEVTVKKRWGNGNPSVVLEYFNIADPSTFIKKDYTNTGILVTEEHFADYVLEGPTYHFFESGDTIQSMQYINGRVDGKVKVWYKSGQLKSLAMYKRDTLMEMNRFYSNGQRESKVPIVDGVLEGEAEYYDTLGNVVLTGRWVNNKREGEWKHLSSSGKVTAIELYKDNIIVETKDF